MQYIPLLLSAFRWNIEVSYYEQKTFWSLCSYMVCSYKGVEMLVNLINITYCAMKLLPYQEEIFICRTTNEFSLQRKFREKTGSDSVVDDAWGNVNF